MIIYGLGSNGSGQLGIGHHDDVSSPTPLILPQSLKDDEIVNIASGGNHTLFLSKSGSVYSTGDNEDGRCALDPSIPQTTTAQPVRLSPPSSKVLHCTSTWSGSIFATDDGLLVSCGSGSKGELGLGPNRVAAPAPELITDLASIHCQVVHMDASMAHVVVVLSDGSVFVWGNGKNGQIGDAAEVVWSPRRLVVPFAVVRVACGKDFTCLLSDPARGEIMLMGPNKRDRFDIKTSIPKRLDDWDHVAATWGSIFAKDKAGAIRAWGRNDRGQLGPADIEILSKIAAGSEHVLAQTAKGQVIVWGWGEHGNCGMPVDEQKDVKGRFNVLDIPGHVLTIGAGCATSFIVSEGS
ncbi:RCC1/BLIP-II [Myriangium duriaei CBS 260.36]|uniref:RCC1/BLIP-II n=1 Tax=Myriangium duriaei CBS 260.36 TaxID=1168546 RepID=A0A9P4IT36_9PEZI|nr:RCC1/BLIP-II [Myriangium duriaei CBS 260.36]